MSEQRNLVLAIGLSALVLFGYSYFIAPQLAPPQQEEQVDPASQQAGDAATPKPRIDGAGTAPAPAPAIDVARTRAEARAEAITQVARVPIQSARLTGSLPVVGRRIDDLVLSDYKETLEPDSPSITLLSPTGSAAPYHAAFGWADQDSTLATPDDAT